MGVTGLWTVLQPCARPIKLDTLNKKRLAVDASIWIYQFLKAVRDKEGNALRNSHVVGFFRRICKLLFYGIKPVFVFDGGAPVLKRQTINARKSRREGRRDDAVRTAGKLLAVQMHRRAQEEEDRKRREEARGPRQPAPRDDDEEPLPENLVYRAELNMTERERKMNRTFKKKDAYHLPDLDVSLSEMGAPNDPRIMSQEELEEYARQFHSGEDINLYDFSKIDFNSPFFQSLPPSDRYNILNAARLRSRLRMGYSKEQLDTMFPDRMAFSRFQIDRVKERNELTQRLMNLNGMNGEDFNGPGRIAGERGKEYVLVKNDGVEGGWALGVVSNKNEGEREKPIDVENFGVVQKQQDDDDDEWEEVDGFIDVPIEGLNRLPKPPAAPSTGIDALTSDRARSARKAFYRSRQNEVTNKPSETTTAPIEEEDADALFLPPELPKDNEDEDMDDIFEDVLPPAGNEDEDEDLRRAIAMSLEQPVSDEDVEDKELAASRAAMMNGPRIDKPLDFNKKNAKAGRAFAQVTNNRAQSNVAGVSAPAPAASMNSGFSGPLPFESISLGKSFLRPKKKPEDEGGFEKEEDKEKRKPKPLPPWFSGDVREGNVARIGTDEAQFDGGNHAERTVTPPEPVLRRHETNEVIDLDNLRPAQEEPIEVQSSDDDTGSDVVMGEVNEIATQSKSPSPVKQRDEPNEIDAGSTMRDFVDNEPTMNDLADRVRAEPPPERSKDQLSSNVLHAQREVSIALSRNAGGQGEEVQRGERKEAREEKQGENQKKHERERYVESHEERREERHKEHHEQGQKEVAKEDVDDAEEVEWSESDYGDTDKGTKKVDISHPVGGTIRPSSTRSSSPEFEDIEISAKPMNNLPRSPTPVKATAPELPREDTFDRMPADIEPEMIEDDFSDPEDEELMRQLAEEAEEHARFANSISSRTQLQSAEDYERELKQLRNQQKKDRRDADEVTQVMIQECQQLLQLFGLPYITAPMEAEAQCAELVSLGLVDGIVTDDSDIFLFGGTRVYKNMFNQAKYVECYLSSDLEREYSLTREKIIQIAHLLGSDYTEGLPTVGPVTALEIVSEFSSLSAFKEWWAGVQNGSVAAAEDAKAPFRRKFRKNATKLFLPPVFPDTRVDEAYLRPEVDSDPSPFQWGIPDLDKLRAFLMATIGWGQERADEILVPVIRDMNQREKEGTQSNITQFFTGTVGSGAVRQRGQAPAAGSGQPPAAAAVDGAFAPRRRGLGKSKRMENALGKLHDRAQRSAAASGEGDGADEHRGDEEDGGQESGKDTKAARPGRRKRQKNPPPVRDDVSSEDDGSDAQFEPRKKVARRGKGSAKK